MSKTLSILIPCYNEAGYICSLFEKIKNVSLIENITKQVLVVDDCSTDESVSLIEQYLSANKNDLDIRLIKNERNMGKGHCIKIALDNAIGDFVIIQDADMEYSPSEYNKLLQPIVEGYADVVYGSRFKGSDPHRILFFFHSAGNKLLTFLSNLFTGLNLSDMETGFKMFKTEILKSFTIHENRFGMEPEITAKIARIKNIRIYEVGISYYGRSYKEGKKIGWQDGFRAIYCILKYNLFSKK